MFHLTKIKILKLYKVSLASAITEQLQALTIGVLSFQKWTTRNTTMDTKHVHLKIVRPNSGPQRKQSTPLVMLTKLSNSIGMKPQLWTPSILVK